MIFHFRLTNGKKIVLNVSPDENICYVKKKIAEITGEKTESLNLIYHSKCLEDKSTLADENIAEDDSILIHILKIRRNTNDDDSFHKDSIQKLMELGFPEDVCVTALKENNYNVNDAAEFLLADPNEEENTINDDDSDEDNDESKKCMLCQEIKEHPEMISFYLNEFIKSNPTFASFIREDTASFMVSIGFKLEEYNYLKQQIEKNHKKITESFNDSDKEAIERLQNIGIDEITAAQVYDACEKNEEAAKDILEEMLSINEM